MSNEQESNYKNQVSTPNRVTDGLLDLEPDLGEYIDAAIFEAHCDACKLRTQTRQAARKHHPQSFGRL